MKTNRMSLELIEVQSVINKMDTKFDTHEFINVFKTDYAEKYEAFVKGYKTIPTGNAQIGKFLSKYRNELHIQSLGRTTSTNMYGQKTGAELWEKV